jgi:hypothetical protein
MRGRSAITTWRVATLNVCGGSPRCNGGAAAPAPVCGRVTSFPHSAFIPGTTQSPGTCDCNRHHRPAVIPFSTGLSTHPCGTGALIPASGQPSRSVHRTDCGFCVRASRQLRGGCSAGLTQRRKDAKNYGDRCDIPEIGFCFKRSYKVGWVCEWFREYRTCHRN